MTNAAINHHDFAFSGTKAETLAYLEKHLTSACILPLYYFTLHQWLNNRTEVLAHLRDSGWFSIPLVIRSSTLTEDSHTASCAGKYLSLVNVQGEEATHQAIQEVINAYAADNEHEHQVLIQPLLQSVSLFGVAFSLDPNSGGPYYVINYDDSGNTTDVTSGAKNSKVYIHHHDAIVPPPAPLDKIIVTFHELSALLHQTTLDIEFAFDDKQQLYIFQARPLVHCNLATSGLHKNALHRIAAKITAAMRPHPYLYGKQTVYGVMPDWNPAEIIGARPKPLALSLYRELITNAVWAYQRNNYGYCNLRSFPLLVDFEGLPYIDVRVSFNSFIPKELRTDTAEKLVNYYLNRLIQSPALHDKVEFDIVFSCYTLDLKDRLNVLIDYGFDHTEKENIYGSLVNLTNQIIHNQEGLWRKDLEKIHELEQRQLQIFSSDLDPIAKMYWIVEDCKRYGTLPFAGLARAGFIAVQILKSLVTVGIINEQDYANFLSSVHSVSTEMTQDFKNLTQDEFLSKYGHLRPGTYDILSPRYDEAPDLYFDWSKKNIVDLKAPFPFTLTISQLRQLQAFIDKDGLQTTALELLEFIKIAIESREVAKFIFTRSVSELLKQCEKFAATHHITREECAYLNINTLINLYSSSCDTEESLRQNITQGKKWHALTKTIVLPPLITMASQVWSFALPETHPNFITQKSATAHVVTTDMTGDLANAIVCITSADPGFDWIFSHPIAGFITQYGGVNSHMAIRAGELGIPAVIGVGEVRFNQWRLAKRLHIDCLNKQVMIL